MPDKQPGDGPVCPYSRKDLGWHLHSLSEGCGKSCGDSHLSFCLPHVNSVFPEAQFAYACVKNCNSFLLHTHHVPDSLFCALCH